MTHQRNHQRNDRLLSSTTATGAVDHHEYPTHTLFDQIKDKKVLNIGVRKKNTCSI